MDYVIMLINDLLDTRLRGYDELDSMSIVLNVLHSLLKTIV